MEARPAVDDAALGHAALAVLNGNWTGQATVPSPGLYPYQWSWDSALVAIGLSRRAAARARTELAGLMDGQWATGMIPHILFRPASHGAYFPGPEVWRSADHPAAPVGLATSGITQPPLHAYAAWWIWRHSPDRDDATAFVRAIWPALAAQHDYLTKYRDLTGNGLAAIIHPWESGIDDSPAWDRPLAARNGFHEQYVTLAVGLREAGYDAGYIRAGHPFAVEDPLFNGVWLASSWAMTELARACGRDALPYREAADRIRAGLVTRLWDSAGRIFLPRDVRTGCPVPVRTVGGFIPMLDPGLPAECVQAMVELLESPHFMGATGYPVPSCDTRIPEFDRGRYWRGPSWVNTNWLIWRATRVHGLADLGERLAAATLRLVRHSGFRECFDPFDGTGRGSRDFSWSAALALDLLDAPSQ